jgi:hypothetical protein
LSLIARRIQQPLPISTRSHDRVNHLANVQEEVAKKIPPPAIVQVV